MKTVKSYLEMSRPMIPLWGSCARSITLVLDAEGKPEFCCHWDDPVAAPFLKSVWQNRGVMGIMECFIEARIAVDGPKIFRPTYEQCLALEQVEPRMSVNDYRQPYPTMMVEFPERYQAILETDSEDFAKRTERAAPFCCTIHHDAELPCLVISTLWSNGLSIVRTIHHFGCAQTIQEVISNAKDLPDDAITPLPEEESSSLRAFRVALNGLLLLTMYPGKVAPENPSHYARLERYLTNARKHGDTEQAARDLRMSPLLCEFEQRVVLYDELHTDRRDSVPTGATVGIHWRRGHMRNQPHGPANTLRKLIFIKPVLIHSERGAGPETVIYESSSFRRDESSNRS